MKIEQQEQIMVRLWQGEAGEGARELGGRPLTFPRATERNTAPLPLSQALQEDREYRTQSPRRISVPLRSVGGIRLRG